MTRKAKLMLVAIVTLLPCQDKFWNFLCDYSWLWGGKH